LSLSLAQTSSTKSSKEQPLTEEELRQRLLLIPEVSLDKESAQTSDESWLRRQLEKQARAIKQKNKNGLDGFVRELQKERADLAGLPFVVGKGFLRESVA